jgi:hypothetical protein
MQASGSSHCGISVKLGSSAWAASQLPSLATTPGGTASLATGDVTRICMTRTADLKQTIQTTIVQTPFQPG